MPMHFRSSGMANKAHSIPTTAPESGDGASENVSTSAGDKISLDDIIAKLTAAGNEDTRGEEILAAAITLRDPGGRDRNDALRKMANALMCVRLQIQNRWLRL